MALRNNRIAELRKKNGYTQAQIIEKISEVTGKSFRQATISTWENNKALPEMDILMILADLFHVSLDNLFERPVTTYQEEGVFSSEALKEKLVTLKQLQQQYHQSHTADIYNQITQLTAEVASHAIATTEKYEELKLKFEEFAEFLKFSH